jgi:hypothetical protein
MEFIRTRSDEIVGPHLDDADSGFVEPELKLYVRIEASEVDIRGVEECEPRILHTRKSAGLGQGEENLITSLAFEGEEIDLAAFIDRTHRARVTARQGIARTQGYQTLQSEVVGSGADQVVGPHLDDVRPGFLQCETHLPVRIEASQIDIRGAEKCEPGILRTRKPCGFGQCEEDLLPGLAFEREEFGRATFIDRARLQRTTRQGRHDRTQRDQTLQAQIVESGADQIVGLYLDGVSPGFFECEPYLYVRIEASERDIHGVNECDSRILRARKPSGLGQRDEDFIPDLAFEAEEVGLARGSDAAIRNHRAANEFRLRAGESGGNRECKRSAERPKNRAKRRKSIHDILQ